MANSDSARRSDRNLVRIVVELLQRPRGWRTDQLMEELGIEPRTYRKWRKVLEEEAADLIGRRGVQVVEVEESDGTYLRLLEPEELATTSALERLGALYLAQQLFGFAGDTPLVRELSAASDEVNRRVGQRKGLEVRLNRIRQMLHYVPSAPKIYSGKEQVVRRLLQAVLERRRVTARYRGLEDAAARERTLEPYTVVLYRDGLYLVAMPVGDPRHDAPITFAFERFEQVTVLEASFTYPADFKPADFFHDSFGIFRSHARRTTTVELLFAADERLHRIVRERKWHASQRFAKEADGRLRMTMKVPSLIEVAPWVRQFGAAVEVVRPEGGLDGIGLGLAGN